MSSGGLAAETPRELRARPSRLEQLPATRRMFILLSGILDLGVVSPAVRALTRAPRSEMVTIDGVPTELVTPAGRGPRPAFVFVNGAHPLRRREPIVQQVADGLGRAGFVVVIPDLPGLGEGELTPPLQVFHRKLGGTFRLGVKRSTTTTTNSSLLRAS